MGKVNIWITEGDDGYDIDGDGDCGADGDGGDGGDEGGDDNEISAWGEQ